MWDDDCLPGKVATETGAAIDEPNSTPTHGEPTSQCRIGRDSKSLASVYSGSGTPSTKSPLCTAVPPKPEVQLLQIQRILKAGTAAEKSELATGRQSFVFHYKKRKCVGAAIHVASLCAEGVQVVKELLAINADIHAECRYVSFNQEGTAQAIHLAVQSGNSEMLEVLCENGANINARARRDDIDHFCPLHEAAFFRDLAMAHTLLELRAQIDAQNLEKMSPLHVAAKMGAAEVAEILVRYGANIHLEDSGDRTALRVAVESGVFPLRRLFLLARWRIGDILAVAEHCPSAAADFMRDLQRNVAGTSTGQAQKAWSAALLQEDEPLEVRHWADLMDQAPEAAVQLLEVLTVEPDEDSTFYHPLPTQACVDGLRCEYNTDETWKCETESQQGNNSQWPEWHERLAPGLQRRPTKLPTLLTETLNAAQAAEATSPDLQPVHIRQLRMRGLVCEEVLHVLAETLHLDVFRSQPIQSVLNFVWKSFVRRYYTARILSKVIELVVLSWWTLSPPEANGGFDWWRRRATWSLMLVFATRETVAEAFKLRGYMSAWKSARVALFGNWSSFFSILSTTLFDAFVIRAATANDFDITEDTVLFAWLVLSRWLLFLWALAPYDLGSIGVQGIIPILHSIKELMGMMLICTVTFFGFVHAWTVLDQGATGGPWEMSIMAIRLLILVDGSVGLDQLLQLGDRPENGDVVTLSYLVMAVLIFCISLLNLFIAVHSEAYGNAYSHAHGVHCQERAAISLHCMMQPSWPFFSSKRSCSCFRLLSTRLSDRNSWLPIGVCCLLTSAASVVWAALLLIDQLHPAVPALAVLLPAVFLADCLLLQRPWESEEVRASSFLWWCAPTHPKGAKNVLEDHHSVLEAVAERMIRLEERLEDIRFQAHTASSTATPAVSMSHPLGPGSPHGRRAKGGEEMPAMTLGTLERRRMFLRSKSHRPSNSSLGKVSH